MKVLQIVLDARSILTQVPFSNPAPAPHVEHHGIILLRELDDNVIFESQPAGYVQSLDDEACPVNMLHLPAHFRRCVYTCIKRSTHFKRGGELEWCKLVPPGLFNDWPEAFWHWTYGGTQGEE